MILTKSRCVSGLLRVLRLSSCPYHSSKMAESISRLDPVKPMAAIVQMTSTPDKEANFAQARALIHRAKARGADMVFLPECFDKVGETRQQALAHAEPLDGDTIMKYRDLARQSSLWLSLGGFHEQIPEEDGRICNTHVVIDNQGDIKGKYSKVHLFDVDIKGKVRLKETDFTRPGDKIGPPVQTPIGNVGLAISECYDMRFPELSLALCEQGAEILTYPSAFTVATGMAHWKVLLRSRAIETQCYVIAAAQVGQHHSKRSSYGHAMIVDPWGCVVAECHDQVDVALAEIDLTYLHRRRKEMPVANHRRHDLYGHFQLQTKCSIDSQAVYQFGQFTVPSSAVFYRSPLCVAFVNKKPVLPGHVLVMPLRYAKRFSDLQHAEVADLFTTVQTVSRIIEKRYGCTSATVSIQDGPEAGQTVDHIHVHILPRKQGDFQKNDDIYEKLEHHDQDLDITKWRTDEDMAVEASQLRPYF